MSNLSLQLYTIREELETNREQALDVVASTGITEVEPFGITGFREWLPEALAKRGLKVTTTHTDVLGDFDNSVAALKEVGGTTLVQPFFDPQKWTTQEGIQELATALNAAAKKAAAEGLKVGYHNHHFEFFTDFDGVNSYDYFVSLLDPEVVLEVDTYWVTVAGHDVLALLERLGDRVTHLHVKDGPAPVTTEFSMEKHAEQPANQVLGQGKIDLDALLNANPDKTWVVEFDKTDGAILDDVVASISYLQNR
ncbi:sugar phosphate isomerase/epimerase family protein [Aestuariimicrobium soli]|uniref:sugar phosphate isomerase/epimerase family protein n=1 Tax=Aestuariimicrobium soli TaxID=2035834 RepID=UPI003EBCA8EF